MLSKQSRKSRVTTESGERDQINLSRSAFARLLDSIFFPNPDDSGRHHGPFGPFGPAGPVSRLLWTALNPQPLPPEPDPYRSAFAARAVITRATAQADFAEMLGNKGSENGIIVVGGKVSDIVDEWCGTPVPGRHGPGPHFVSLFSAGAQFQRAADSMRDSALHSVFLSAAKKLFKTALSQMESEH